MKQNNFSPGNRTVTFRQWSRKPFAVFASLNKVIKIAFMAQAVGLIIAPTVGFSQTDTLNLGDHVDVDEVVVTGEREAVAVSQILRPLTIISAQSVKESPQQSLTDLLDYIPSIDLRQRGLLGTQADISIRGGSFDQNVILLNGINFTDPQTGHLNLTLPIESDDISRIEVLQGPAGFSVGANAFSGVVGFFTPTDTMNRIKAHLMNGDFNLYKTSTSISLNYKKWNSFVAISSIGSDGYKPNTDFKTHNLFYRGVLNLPAMSLNYQVGFTDKAFGSNGFYSLKYPEQFEENRAWLSSIGFSTGHKIKLTTNIYNRILNDHYILIKSNPKVYENYHQTNLTGLNSQIRMNSFLGRTIIGFDLRSESIRSNRLGEVTGKQEKVKGADSVFYDHFFDRKYVSAHLEQSYQYGILRATIGGIAHFNFDSNSATGFYPGIDFGIQATRNVKIFVSVNKSFRMPTFTDLFYVGSTNIGNRTLKAEKITNYETGIMIHSSTVKGSGSLFYKQGTDVIDWVRHRDSINDVYVAENISTLNMVGVELNAGISTGKCFKNPFIYLSHLGSGFTYIEVAKSSHNLKSMYALDQLTTKLSLSAKLVMFEKGMLSAQLVYQDRFGSYDKIDPNTNLPIYDPITNLPISEAIKPFYTLDAKYFWQFKYFNPYIEITNILNTRYYDFNGLTLPGRWYKAGIQFDIPILN